MSDIVPVGSREYWADPRSYPEDWSSRSQHAARFISAGSRVLDIGCGPTMALSRYLPEGCTYLPSDLVAWTPDVRLIDVDAGILPDEPFDVVTILGVIEYLGAPEKIFRHCRGRARSIILSYCHSGSDETAFRQSAGWVNDFASSDLPPLFELSGLKVIQSEVFRKSPLVIQMLYVLSSE